MALLWEQLSTDNVPLMCRESHPCICTHKPRTQVFQKYKGYLHFTRGGKGEDVKVFQQSLQIFFFNV